MSEEKREVNVTDDADEDVITHEQAQSLEQEPESSAGAEEESNESERSEELEDESNGESEQSEESEENNDSESSDESDTTPAVHSKEPKPVEGETPREFALRKEVERLRGLNRDLSKSGVFKKTKIPKKEIDVSSLLEAGYTEEEIESSKKLIGVLAPAMGFVNQDQTYQDKANQELDNFLEDHQEYLPKNDKDDMRFNKFLEIIKSDYNLNGKSPAQLRSIYSKVDRDVREEFGEAKTENSKNKLNAQTQKIKSVSHTGGNKSISSTQKSKPAREVDGVKFTGFDDDDLE